MRELIHISGGKVVERKEEKSLPAKPFRFLKHEFTSYGSIDSRVFEPVDDDDVIEYLSELYDGLSDEEVERRRTFYDETTKRAVSGDVVEYHRYEEPPDTEDKVGNLIYKLIVNEDIDSLTDEEKSFIEAVRFNKRKDYTSIAAIVNDIVAVGKETGYQFPFLIVVSDWRHPKAFNKDVMVRESDARKNVHDIKQNDKVYTAPYGKYDPIFSKYYEYYTKCLDMGVEPHDCEIFNAIVKHFEKDDRTQKWMWTNIKFVGAILMIITILCIAILHVSPPSEKTLFEKGYTKQYIYIDNISGAMKTVDNVIDYVKDKYPTTLSLYSEKELKKEIKTENDIGLLGKDVNDLTTIKVPIVVKAKEVSVTIDKTSGKYKEA
jgi:hypothetical protein